MLTLPQAHRERFKEPFGSLYSDFLEVVPKVEKRMLCTVGDVVTQNAYAAGVIPAISIIDGVTKRNNAVQLLDGSKISVSGETISDETASNETVSDENFFCVKNPAGTITDELIQTLEMVVARYCGVDDDTLLRSSIVWVDGEEDLAVLPLIGMLPDSAIILYGQPNEGVVFCEVNDELRKTAEHLLAFFKKS